MSLLHIAHSSQISTYLFKFGTIRGDHTRFIVVTTDDVLENDEAVSRSLRSGLERDWGRVRYYSRISPGHHLFHLRGKEVHLYTGTRIDSINDRDGLKHMLDAVSTLWISDRHPEYSLYARLPNLRRIYCNIWIIDSVPLHMKKKLMPPMLDAHYDEALSDYVVCGPELPIRLTTLMPQLQRTED